MDQQKLAQLNLSIDTIARRLREENVNLSGGRLEQGTQRFLVRTLNEFSSVAADGRRDHRERRRQARLPPRRRDVTSGYKDREAITRVDGRESVELAIYKEGDANTVQLAAGIRARVEELGKSLPAGSELKLVYDQSKFISSAIGEVRDAALIGGVLAILVLYLFLRDARATMITGIAIPVSVIGTFVLMYAFDLSLNIMSLGGIALAVGMLVDNAVVVLENIVRHRERGLSRARSGAARGTSEVGDRDHGRDAHLGRRVLPDGVHHRHRGPAVPDQALTVSFALLFSLIVAMTLVPMLAAGKPECRRLPDPERSPGQAGRGIGTRACAGSGADRRRSRTACPGSLGFAARPTQAGFAAVQRAYLPALRWSLAAPRPHRRWCQSASCCLTAALVPRLGSELIPQLSQGEFIADLRLRRARRSSRPTTPWRRPRRMPWSCRTSRSPTRSTGTGNRLDASPTDAGENTGTALASR